MDQKGFRGEISAMSLTKALPLVPEVQQHSFSLALLGF